MPEDDRTGAIWRLLRDRVPDEVAPTDDEQVSLRFRRESLVPVLDAALGVLAATRHLVEVTEDVIREQRDRIASAPGPGADAEASRSRAGDRKKIDLSY
jgi:hypothetical protein